jgi:hypothetical protein
VKYISSAFLMAPNFVSLYGEKMPAEPARFFLNRSHVRTVFKIGDSRRTLAQMLFSVS